MSLSATVLLSTVTIQARTLTFEDRVKAQEAVERVYYSHQIGATKSFEDAVPRSLLEQKVRTYLKQSVALDKFWNTPVTAAILRSEVERMAQQTRMPERLRELYAALEDDPFLIQECLARPALVDRLSRNFFAYDSVLHAAARLDAEGLHEDLASGRINSSSEHPARTVTHVVRIAPEEQGGSGGGGKAVSSIGRDPSQLDLEPEEFDRYAAELPEGVGEIGPVAEGREAFTVRVVLDRNEGEVRFATYVVRKLEWDVWWHSVEGQLEAASVEAVATGDGPLPVPAYGRSEKFSSSTCLADDTWDNGSLDEEPRAQHTAVWTGSLMIVWGGQVIPPGNTGARYDPATDTWTPTSTANAPSVRSNHTAVWTGSLMVVWGGYDGSPLNSGGRYDPATDTWTPTSTINAPMARYSHTAIWTGSLMVVWGGLWYSSPLDTGARYDPATDTWTPTSTTNAPSPRRSHTAVWTGSLMIVWAGFDGYSYLNSGGRYDPATDLWTPTSMSNAPLPRGLHTAVWTGNLMVAWGGQNASSYLNSGGRYDPATDTWSSTSALSAPSPRVLHTVVWAESLMVVWGGLSPSLLHLNTGGRYDPVNDSWAPTSITNAPAPRRLHTAVWTGSLMVVWGGYVRNASNTGGRYNPANNTWTPTSTTNVPSPRVNHTAVWTGSLMVVWGGIDNFSPLNTGGRYDPATDTWTPTSATSAPSPRQLHTAVWTGNLMVLWGGWSSSLVLLNTGGRYDPAADTWTPTSITDAPSSRLRHTAVWTGKLMVVWGGVDASLGRVNTGGRYDPVTDTWTPTSATNAPSPRADHTAIWTGSHMVVWGGGSNTGGRYNPASDTWTPTSTTNAPAGFSAVWTGSVMVVWGAGNNTGGRYDPVTDTWTPTSTANAPSPRTSYSAIWTGGHMVVWGGYNGSGDLNTGGRYDPITDAWTATSLTNAPSARSGHTAVWTGGLMVVWGGSIGGTGFLNTGGRYALEQSVDDDEDGFSECRGDCDDENPSVHPGTAEICNSIDDDCDGLTDEGFDPEAIAVSVTPNVLWPPNHRMVDIHVTVTITGGCGTSDSAPAVILSSVTSDEPDNATGTGDGNTVNDIQDVTLGTADFDLQLRAEREGTSDGRVYTLIYTATDQSGKAITAMAHLFVPDDQLGTTEPMSIHLSDDGSGSLVSWNEVPGALYYSVVRGNARYLREGDTFIDLGAVTCLEAYSRDTSTVGHEDLEMPRLGEAFFYLAAYNDGWGSTYGTESVAKPRVASSGACE